MAVCPFCGNEVEDFDFMCGKCGKALEPTAGGANIVSNYSNSAGNSAGYNPYGGSGAGTGSLSGGYNPYAGSNIGTGSSGSGYNPYGGSKAVAGGSSGGYNSYEESKLGEDGSYNSYNVGMNDDDNTYDTGGGLSGDSSGYNPYSSSPSGDSSGYNPYSSSLSGNSGGYNPYSSSPSGNSGGYNPYSSSPSGSSGGYNPYSSSPSGNSSGYNPYSSNSENSRNGSYNNSGGLSQDTDSSDVGYQPSKYGAYNSSLDTSQNSDKVKKQKNKNQVSSLLKGVIVVAVIAVIIVIGYPMVKDLFGKPYASLVQESMVAVQEQDYEKLKELLALDYEKMLKDIYGSQYNQAVTVLRQQKAANVRNMKEKYGDDYTIKTSIMSVTNMSGNLKQEAIDRAKSEYEDIFKVANTDLKLNDYFKEEDITHIKRLRVKVTIEGSKKSETNECYVDIAKLDNNRGWKFVEAYEKVN